MADQTPRSQPMLPNPPERLIVGQVVAPFGVKGELKVNILTEFPDRFRKLPEVVLAPFSSIEPGLAPTAALDPATLPHAPARGPKPPSAPTPYNIESTHIHKGQLLLKLEGVDTADDAEALRGYWVLVPLENAQKLPKGAYYIYQIVGLEVFTEAGDLIGRVSDVLTTSANDVYVVKGPGVPDPSGELLVPAVKHIVKRIDPNSGRIIITDPREWS